MKMDIFLVARLEFSFCIHLNVSRKRLQYALFSLDDWKTYTEKKLIALKLHCRYSSLVCFIQYTFC